MHATMQPPEKAGTELPPRGCARTRVQPHHWWAPLATAFAWSVRLWALILPMVTDGSSSVFWWAFPFIFDLRLF